MLNPTGINRKRPYSDEYHAYAISELPEEIRLKVNAAYEKQFGIKELLPQGTTWARAQILRQEVQALMEPAVHLTSEMADRTEGKPPQRFDLTGMERQEVTIKVIVAEQKPARQNPPINVIPIQVETSELPKQPSTLTPTNGSKPK